MEKLTKLQRDFCEENIGTYQSVYEISGGLIHKVYRLENERNVFYLKIRDPKLSQVEGVLVQKQDVLFEFNALTYFFEKQPSYFPEPIAVDVKNGLLLMGDALSGSVSLMENFKEDNGICSNNIIDIARNLGTAVGKAHEQSLRETEEITLNQHNDFTEILRFRYDYLKIAKLDEVVATIVDTRQTLLLGGLSPKNILVAKDNRVAFVDLETACYGHAIFDYAFCIAHILLHQLHSKNVLKECYDEYSGAYRGNSKNVFNQQHVTFLILGTFLYRLDNSAVPYTVNINKKKQQMLVEKIRTLFVRDQLTVSDILNEIASL